MVEFSQIDEKDIVRGSGVIDECMTVVFVNKIILVFVVGQMGIFRASFRAGVNINNGFPVKQAVDAGSLCCHDCRHGGNVGISRSANQIWDFPNYRHTFINYP